MRGDVEYPEFFSVELKDLLSNMFKTNSTDRYSLSDVKRHSWFLGLCSTSQFGEEATPEVSNTMNSSVSVPEASELMPCRMWKQNRVDYMDFFLLPLRTAEI